MTESSIRGVSVRAWLALVAVVSGLAFLYLMAFVAIWLLDVETALQIVLTIVTAVIGFIKGERGAGKIIESYVNAHSHMVRPRRRRRVRRVLKHSGRFFNLKEMLDTLNEDYLDRKAEAAVTWGRQHHGQRHQLQLR